MIDFWKSIFEHVLGWPVAAFFLGLLFRKPLTALVERIDHIKAPGDSTELQKEKERELELKLILSSDLRGWNLSENIIFEKICQTNRGSLRASSRKCSLCPENFAAGAELYGGLGDRYTPGTRLTSQYLGPVANWQVPNGPRFSVGTGFGLNDYSPPRIFRVGIAYKAGQIRSLFRRKGARN
jgi:hypothetical protein